MISLVQLKSYKWGAHNACIVMARFGSVPIFRTFEKCAHVPVDQNGEIHTCAAFQKCRSWVESQAGSIVIVG